MFWIRNNCLYRANRHTLWLIVKTHTFCAFIGIDNMNRIAFRNCIRAASRVELQRILDFWKFDNVEIIAAAPERKEIKSYREDVETAILETIARRPCTLDDLVNILGLHINEINKYLDVLEADKKIKILRQPRGNFYQIK